MYSWGEIVRSLPKKKNSKSSLWVKWIIRKLSFPFTFLFINLGFSAWSASVLSIFVALAGCTALCVDSALWRAVGVVLVELWLVMDCVDGNIARVKKTSSPMGGCIDAHSAAILSPRLCFSPLASPPVILRALQSMRDFGLQWEDYLPPSDCWRGSFIRNIPAAFWNLKEVKRTGQTGKI